MSNKDFLSLLDFSKSELEKILKFAIKLKKKPVKSLLKAKQLLMFFEKNSTRTRISFEVGMNQLGGSAVVLQKKETQLGNASESIADTAKVMSRYGDAIMIRAYSHDDVKELAANATIPVINGLTDHNHPCQLMADLQTIIETKGKIDGLKIVWLGDGNNMCHSWIEAACRFDINLNILVPKKYPPDNDLLEYAIAQGAQITIDQDIEKLTKNADVVVTDAWISMGDKNRTDRIKSMKAFQVNDEVMSYAKQDAIFLHCLPAHRGEEVTDSVIDSKNSVVFDEAENRLHAQKAIICYLLGVFK
jgi:ornithine carbamoyltransferase